MEDLAQIGGESAAAFFGQTGMLSVLANDRRIFPGSTFGPALKHLSIRWAMRAKGSAASC